MTGSWFFHKILSCLDKHDWIFPALCNSILKQTEKNHLRQLKAKQSGKTIEKLIEEECRKRGISPLELKGGGKRRKVSDTRAVIALRGRDSAAGGSEYIGCYEGNREG
ncbi:MAG: hypothetical protein WC649_04975 [Desulfobacteria bacterium]